MKYLTTGLLLPLLFYSGIDVPAEDGASHPLEVPIEVVSTSTINVSAQLRDIADQLERSEIVLKKQRQYLSAILQGELILQLFPDGPKFHFVYIPNGTFIMGTTMEERIAYRLRFAERNEGQKLNTTIGHNTTPQFRVAVQQGYFMLESELTQSQYNLLKVHSDEQLPAIESDTSNGTTQRNHPASNMTWTEATEYCQLLGDRVGFTIRLPTEIEWEYAARGQYGWTSPWEPNAKNKGVFHGYINATSTRPCSSVQYPSKDETWRGMFDMSGNISEWCLDEYRQSYEVSNPSLHSYDPTQISSADLSAKGAGTGRVYRGGNFTDHEIACHVSFRRDFDETQSSPQIGFRPVLLLQSKVQTDKDQP